MDQLGSINDLFNRTPESTIEVWLDDPLQRFIMETKNSYGARCKGNNCSFEFLTLENEVSYINFRFSDKDYAVNPEDLICEFGVPIEKKNGIQDTIVNRFVREIIYKID